MSEVKLYRADWRHVVQTVEDDAQYVGINDYKNKCHSSDTYYRAWKHTAQELDAQRLRADTAEDNLAKFEGEIVAALPGVRFMDLPDGGSPTLGEQVKRMAEALAAAEQRNANMSALLVEWLVGEKEKDWLDFETRVQAPLNHNPEAESHE